MGFFLWQFQGVPSKSILPKNGLMSFLKAVTNIHLGDEKHHEILYPRSKSKYREGLMLEKAFRDVLASRGLAEAEIDLQVGAIQKIEAQLKSQAQGWSLDDLNHATGQELVDGMIDRGEQPAGPGPLCQAD
jgi:hypothetical protein